MGPSKSVRTWQRVGGGAPNILHIARLRFASPPGIFMLNTCMIVIVNLKLMYIIIQLRQVPLKHTLLFNAHCMSSFGASHISYQTRISIGHDDSPFCFDSCHDVRFNVSHSLGSKRYTRRASYSRCRTSIHHYQSTLRIPLYDFAVWKTKDVLFWNRTHPREGMTCRNLMVHPTDAYSRCGMLLSARPFERIIACNLAVLAISGWNDRRKPNICLHCPL